jgi:hypothetical protein
MTVKLLEQHKQQQRDDYPDGRFGKHVIHEDSLDAKRIFYLWQIRDFTRNKQGVPKPAVPCAEKTTGTAGCFSIKNNIAFFIS